MAYPNAITIVKSCVDAAVQVGFPECAFNLAQAVLVLATAPKSDSAGNAIFKALDDIRTKEVGQIPPPLRDAHYSGSAKLGHGVDYKYPHDYPNHYVQQQYLPDELVGTRYYEPCENKTERAIRDYLGRLKGEQ